MILPIYIYGQPVLRKVAEDITPDYPELKQLITDMWDTLARSEGVGLAAPQVAVLRRVVVMDIGEGLIEMVNPEIVEMSGEQEDAEGCLSVPGRRGMVKRAKHLRVKFQDRFGHEKEMEAEDLLARCIQHETDHLDGRLYVDIMTREVFDEEEDGEETD